MLLRGPEPNRRVSLCVIQNSIFWDPKIPKSPIFSLVFGVFSVGIGWDFRNWVGIVWDFWVPNFLGLFRLFLDNSAKFLNVLGRFWNQRTHHTATHTYNTNERSYRHGDVYTRFFLESLVTCPKIYFWDWVFLGVGPKHVLGLLGEGGSTPMVYSEEEHTPYNQHTENLRDKTFSLIGEYTP